MGKYNLQRNFEGYLNTPLLWQDAEVYGFKQMIINGLTRQFSSDESTNNLHLGKLLEQFVFHQLKDDSTCSILAKNVQIQDDKRTIGELDALLMTENGPVHLEIIYKFYLYDPSAGLTELSHYIGLNRKDNLLHKVHKLKEKQQPLLYHSKTQFLLNDLGLILNEIKQQVLFKAQLFLPFDDQKVVFHQLNPACVKGFYLKFDDLKIFKTGQFYIPDKIDWLMDIPDDVTWMSFDDFLIKLNRWKAKNLAPMFWLKDAGNYSKFFVVWW